MRRSKYISNVESRLYCLSRNFFDTRSQVCCFCGLSSYLWCRLSPITGCHKSEWVRDLCWRKGMSSHILLYAHWCVRLFSFWHTVIVAAFWAAFSLPWHDWVSLLGPKLTITCRNEASWVYSLGLEGHKFNSLLFVQWWGESGRWQVTGTEFTKWRK